MAAWVRGYVTVCTFFFAAMVEHEVEAILDERIVRRRTQYLVLWKGDVDLKPTWTDRSDLPDVHDFKTVSDCVCKYTVKYQGAYKGRACMSAGYIYSLYS